MATHVRIPALLSRLLDEERGEVAELLAELLRPPYAPGDAQWAKVKAGFVASAKKHGEKYALGVLSEELRAQEAFRAFAVPALAAAFARRWVLSLKDPSTRRTLGGQMRRKLAANATESELSPKRYDEKLTLLGFVAERAVGFLDLLGGEQEAFRFSGMGGPSPALALCEEWNRLHPYWRYEAKAPKDPEKLTPATASFARAYGRALEPQRGLFNKLVKRVKRAARAQLDLHETAMREMGGWFARYGHRGPQSPGEEAEWAQVLAALDAEHSLFEPPAFTNRHQYEQWRAQDPATHEADWRASVSLESLVAQRIDRAFWGAAPDDQAQQDLLSTPLRDWFLPEARGEPLRLHRSAWGAGLVLPPEALRAAIRDRLAMRQPAR